MGSLGGSWERLGGFLEPLADFLEPLGKILEIIWVIWGAAGCIWGSPGALLEFLRRVLGGSWVHFGSILEAFGVCFGAMLKLGKRL